MKKIILFKGEIETLEYFSLELKKAFEQLGHCVFVFDFSKEDTSFLSLCSFIEEHNTVLITFNFTGIRGDEIFYNEQEELFWNIHQIPCVNIVVDHPFYYDKLLKQIPDCYYQISIDRFHETYIKTYYPHINCLPFLPLGGTNIVSTPIPMEKRTMPVVFVGNYSPLSTFLPYITRINEEYTEFYYSMIHELIEHPNRTMEDVMKENMLSQIGNLSNVELREGMSSLIFIDLYVRFYFRGLVVKTLVEHNIPVHVFGGNWDKLDCNKKENLIIGGSLNSEQCLRKISYGKLSLNVMPWFKDGAHDRIFNSQLNYTPCLTDDSIYLKEQFADLETLSFYNLDKLDLLPDIANHLLCSPKLCEEISHAGYEEANKYHTWEKRGEYLSWLIEHFI